MKDSMLMRREYVNVIKQLQLDYDSKTSLYFLEQINQYAFYGKLDNNMSTDLLMLFLPIKNQIDIDMEKYDKKLKTKARFNNYKKI